MSDTDFRRWKCLTCQDQPEFEHETFIEHMQSVHNVPRNAKGQRRMLKHIDARTWFQTDSEWIIGEVKAIESDRQPRSVDDLMYWMNSPD